MNNIATQLPLPLHYKSPFGFTNTVPRSILQQPTSNAHSGLRVQQANGTHKNDKKFFSHEIHFQNPISYEERLKHSNWESFVGTLWNEVFIQQDLDPNGVVVEIAPGSSAKIAYGLQSIGFKGTIYLVDPEIKSLEKARDKYKKILPEATVHILPTDLAQAIRWLPQNCDALISNNPLDDMIVGKSFTTEEFNRFFDGCYDHEYEIALKAWQMLEQNPLLLEKIKNQVVQEWIQAIEVLKPKLCSISQYESNALRLHNIRFPDIPSFQSLKDIGLHFGRNHFFDNKSIEPPYGGVYDPHRWLILSQKETANVPEITFRDFHSDNSHPKIRMIQMDIDQQDHKKNFESVITQIRQAKADGIDMIVFPQLCITSYFTGDKLESTTYLKIITEYNELIKKETKGITAVWGNIDVDFTKKGKDGTPIKYDAAFVAQNGEWISNGVFLGKTYQTLQANYRTFHKSRHYRSTLDFAVSQNLSLEETIRIFEIPHNGKIYRYGFLIGEDGWTDHSDINPIKILLDQNPDAIIHITQSPWTWQKDRKRISLIQEHLEDSSNVNFLTVNGVGVQNHINNFLSYDGRSKVFNPNGTIKSSLPAYEEAFLDTILDGFHFNQLPFPIFDDKSDIANLYQSIIFVIQKLFANGALVSVSGGIDSTVTMALAAIALGGQKVYAAYMPSEHNDNDDYQIAIESAQNFGTHWIEVPIQKEVERRIIDIQSKKFTSFHDGSETPLLVSQKVYELMQPRERGAGIQALLSSILGINILNTVNKTELFFGYGAINGGNWMGKLSVISDVIKTDVYRLARYINQIHGKQLIPERVFEVPASTKLSDNQVQPFVFQYHDKLLKLWVEFYNTDESIRSPEDILRLYKNNTLERALGLEPGFLKRHFPTVESFIQDLEEKWILHNVTAYKRQISPPNFIVSRRSLSSDYNQSQGFQDFTDEYKILKAELLGQSFSKNDGLKI